MSAQKLTRIVFIVRAYRADEQKFSSDSKKVDRVARELWEADIASLSSLTHSVSSDRGVRGLNFHYFWQDMAKGCDAIVALTGWDTCPYSHAEVSVALGAGVPIFYLEDMTMREVIEKLGRVI